MKKFKVLGKNSRSGLDWVGAHPKKKINISPIQYFSDLKVWWAGAMKRVKQKKQAPKGQP